MDKRRLLERCGLQGEERLAMGRVLDRACRAAEGAGAAATDFLTPAQQACAASLLSGAGIPPEGWLRLGGYPGAERAVLLFLPPWMTAQEGEGHSPIRCLRAAFRPGEGLTHRDFLGSLTALGVAREKIGDILVSPAGADVPVLETVADFLVQNWDSAGRTALRVREIGPEEIAVPQMQYVIRRDTVPSLRLDAVCAAVFHLSRGQASGQIAAGHVQVNGQVSTKPDRHTIPGDALSLRGRGKVRLEAAGAPTKKGRIPITVLCYQ